MKNLRLMSQVRFKLRYLFSQENLIRLLKKYPCYDVLILSSSQQVLEKHRLMYKKSSKVVFKLLSIVRLSKYLRQGVIFKAGNWHALSHEQCFSKNSFQISFNMSVILVRQSKGVHKHVARLRKTLYKLYLTESQKATRGVL